MCNIEELTIQPGRKKLTVGRTKRDDAKGVCNLVVHPARELKRSLGD